MGLNGKAVLPMVLGLGCDTMATLTTRILETPKERVIVTLLLALGVPCSAQLGVIFGMLGQAGPGGGRDLGPDHPGRALPGRLPGGQGAARARARPSCSSCRRCACRSSATSWSRPWPAIEWYLREALPLFVLGTLILFVLDGSGCWA